MTKNNVYVYIYTLKMLKIKELWKYIHTCMYVFPKFFFLAFSHSSHYLPSCRGKLSPQLYSKWRRDLSEMDSVSSVYWLLRESFRRQGYRDTLANQKKKQNTILTRGRGEESITLHRQPDLSIAPDLPLSWTHFLCFQNRAQQQGKTHIIRFYSLIIRAFYSLIIQRVTGWTMQSDAYHIEVLQTERAGQNELEVCWCAVFRRLMSTWCASQSTLLIYWHFSPL